MHLVLNIRPETTELLKETIEKNFNIGLGKDFLEMTPKSSSLRGN